MTYVPHALLVGILLAVLSGYGGYVKGKESASDKAEVQRLAREVASLEAIIDRNDKAYFDAQDILNTLWDENTRVEYITKTVIKEVPAYVAPETDTACAISAELVELLNSTRGYVESLPASGQRADAPAGTGADPGDGTD